MPNLIVYFLMLLLFLGTISGCVPEGKSLGPVSSNNDLALSDKNRQQTITEDYLKDNFTLEKRHVAHESESFSWMLANHSDKIAHYDKSRSILQIKVLDQIVHGARQCGYHSVRNFFYLAALSEAIQRRDSALINKLYNELHNIEHFKLFVKELANIKGCPISHYHEKPPNEEELKELYQKASATFPSSLSLEQILKYGVVKNTHKEFFYYKSPPAKKEKTFFIKFLEEMHRDFDFRPNLSLSLQELLEVKFPWETTLVAALSAEQTLQKHRAFPIHLDLLGEPGHGAAAAVFMPMGERRATFLFADSWDNVSFLSGWSKATMDLLYSLITQMDDARNRSLLFEAFQRFDRMALFKDKLGFVIPDNSVGPLAPMLAKVVAEDPLNAQAILDRLDRSMKRFQDRVKEYDLEKASLYPEIKALIDKIAQTYRDAFR